MKELGIGLIGLGRHGVRYAGHLVNGDIVGGRLVAVGRRNHRAGREQAAEWGATYHESAEALAADDTVDAVVVVSTSDHHVEGVRAVLDAGKPVLIEKPLAPDVRGCDAIAAAAARSNVPVMVAQTTRYEGPVLGLLDALPRIGPIRQIAFLLRSEDRTHDASGAYLPKLADGGALLDSGVHYFDLVHLVAGRVRRVWCDTLFVRRTELNDGYAAVLRTDSDVQVTLSMGRWGSSRFETVELAGEKGSILFSRTPPSLRLVRGRKIEPLPFPDVPGTLVPTMTDFLRVCQGEIEPPITLADGRAAVAVAEACCQSGGAWLDVSPS